MQLVAEAIDNGCWGLDTEQLKGVTAEAVGQTLFVDDLPTVLAALVEAHGRSALVEAMVAAGVLEQPTFDGEDYGVVAVWDKRRFGAVHVDREQLERRQHDYQLLYREVPS